METNFPINWSEEQKEKYKKATKCHICGRVFIHADHTFCSGTIKNPYYEQEMVEYKRRLSEVEDELEDSISETVSNEEPEYDDEEEDVYLGKPRKFIDCPICFGLGSKFQTTTMLCEMRM